jgi:hypothetical protein
MDCYAWSASSLFYDLVFLFNKQQLKNKRHSLLFIGKFENPID